MRCTRERQRDVCTRIQLHCLYTYVEVYLAASSSADGNWGRQDLPMYSLQDSGAGCYELTAFM